MAITLCVADAALRSEPVATHLRLAVAQQLRQRLITDVAVRQVEVGLLPPAVTLEGLRLGRAEAPYLQLVQGRLQPRLYPCRHGAPVLQQVWLDGLVLDSDRLPPRAEAVVSKNDAAPQWRLPCDIRHLTLRQGQLCGSVAGQRGCAQEVALDVHPAAGGRRVQGEATVSGPTVPRLPPAWRKSLTSLLGPMAGASRLGGFAVHLGAQGVLRGDVDRPTALHLAQATLQLPGATCRMQAELDLCPQAFGAVRQAQGSLDADLGALAGVLPQAWPWQGSLHATAAYRPQSTRQLATRLQVDHLAVAGEPLGRLYCEAQLRPEGINVETLRLEQGEAGRLTASGLLDLRSSTRPLQGVARLHDVALPELLRSATIADAWLRGRLDGDVVLEGTLAPLRLQLQGQLAGRNLAILRHSYRHVLPAEPVLALPQARLGGTITLAAGALHLAQLYVATPQATVHGSGSLQRGSLQLRAHGTDVDLAALGPVAEVPLGGRASFEARVAGPLQHLRITAPLAVQGLQLFHIAVGHTLSDVSFFFPELVFRHVRVVAPAPQQPFVQGEVRLRLGGLAPQLHTQLQVRDAPMAKLLDALLPGHMVPPAVQAQLSGEVALGGTLPQIQGSLHLAAPQLRLAGTAVGSLDVALQRTAAASVAAVQVRDGDRSLGLHASMHSRNPWHLSLAAHGAPAQLLHLAVPQAHVSGRVDGTLQLDGRPQALGGTVQLVGRDLRAFDIDLGEVRLRGSGSAAQLQLEGSVRTGSPGHLQGSVPFAGVLRLSGSFPYLVRGELHDFDIDWLLPKLSELRLGIDGTVEAQGALADGRALRAHFAVHSAHLRRGSFAMQLQHPMTIVYEHDRLTLQRSAWAGKHARATLGGSVELDGKLDVRGEAYGDLALFDAFLAPALTAQGPFTARVRATGLTHAPYLGGEARLRDATVLHPATQQSLEQVSARIGFVGREVLLHDGHARLGGGRLRFIGEAVRTPHAGLQLNLRADLQRVQLSALSDLRATLSGDLQLVGPLDLLQLRGNLKVDGARYSPQLELENFIPRRQRLPLPQVASSLGPKLHYQLHVRAPGNVLIVNPVLQAELQADLTLTGTYDRPGLLGSITPLWARAHYRDNAFEVVRASIDFIDEYRIFTEFQLQARTRACNMSAEVTINGNSDGYTIIPFGQDDRGTVDPQDVLTCIQFGLRLHDFEGNQRAPASISDALPGSLDALWTVSGLDAKVRKILPIDVDELRLTSGWSSLSQRTTARVLVGKDLTSQVMLKYSRSLDEYNDQAVSLEYRLARRSTLQGNWLTHRDVPLGDFGVDFRLHWELP